MTDAAQTIAEALGGRRSGKGYVACCPAHDDHDPSLVINDGENGQPVVFCHAGCSQEAVITALAEKGLWPDSGTTLSPEELEVIRLQSAKRHKEGQAKKRQEEEVAANKARQRWEKASPADQGHPYLTKKGIRPHGIRQDGDKLLVPMRDEAGRVWALQTIGPDGDKLFFPAGCRTKGLYYPIGKPVPCGQVCIAEGFATGVAIHESLNGPVAIAFTAGNLMPVARVIKGKLPDITVVLCGDDDQKPDTDRNPGIEAATNAALAVDGKVAVPGLDKRADFWDLWHEQGAESVRVAVANACPVQNRHNNIDGQGVVVDDDQLEEIALLDEDGKKKPKATVLIEIGKRHELFHDHQGSGYSTIKFRSHSETWPLDSGTYRAYLSDQYFQLTQRGCSKNNVNDAIDTLRGAARNNGSLHSVHRRVAGVDGKIYIDLGHPDWRTVEVTADGWQVIDHSPVKFIRSESTGPFSEPISGGDINTIFRFLNVRLEDRPLVLGFLVRALNPDPPYFGMGITGEQGTAKSTTAKNLRNCADPSTSALRPPPKDDRDFLSGAINNWLLCYDNLSGLQPWMADSLCRVLTGGSFASRTLYTTNDETTVPLARPVILNGIDDLTERGDLADRCIVLNLQPIAEVDRLDERTLNREWEAELPGIFGALLDGLSSAIRNVDKVVLPSLPRMADAVMWATAAEEGFNLPPGSFMESYYRNQSESVEVILNASPFSSAVMHFIRDVSTWQGTPSELLRQVSSGVSEDVLRSKAWPKSPEWASRFLRRFVPSLRKIGISYETTRGTENRSIKMTVTAKKLTQHGHGEGSEKKYEKDMLNIFSRRNAVIADTTVIPFKGRGFQHDSNDSNDSKIEKSKNNRLSQPDVYVEEGIL